jgi:hypothetical protein
LICKTLRDVLHVYHNDPQRAEEAASELQRIVEEDISSLHEQELNLLAELADTSATFAGTPEVYPLHSGHIRDAAQRELQDRDPLLQNATVESIVPLVLPTDDAPTLSVQQRVRLRWLEAHDLTSLSSSDLARLSLLPAGTERVAIFRVCRRTLVERGIRPPDRPDVLAEAILFSDSYSIFGEQLLISDHQIRRGTTEINIDDIADVQSTQRIDTSILNWVLRILWFINPATGIPSVLALLCWAFFRKDMPMMPRFYAGVAGLFLPLIWLSGLWFLLGCCSSLVLIVTQLIVLGLRNSFSPIWQEVTIVGREGSRIVAKLSSEQASAATTAIEQVRRERELPMLSE